MKEYNRIADFKNVSFAYNDDNVLEDVTLSVESGDFVSVIGPNGAGKTTLAKLLVGLLEPQQGEVRLLGGRPKANRHRIGYVPQYSRFDRKFPVLVDEVVLMGRLSAWPAFSHRRELPLVRETLERVGIPGLEHRSFNALSGGQRQRVLIARALISQPKLLIMDEPTSNVDSAGEESLKQLLVDLNSDMTIMLITHDLGFVSGMVNKVICVNVHALIHNTHEVTDEMIRNLFGKGARFVEHHTHEDI